jgi:hypothetical protein
LEAVPVAHRFAVGRAVAGFPLAEPQEPPVGEFEEVPLVGALASVAEQDVVVVAPIQVH